MNNFFQSSSEQNKICLLLQKIAKTDISEASARNLFDSTHRSCQFIIGEEVNPRTAEDTNKYFRVYFQDVRMDESSFKIIPCVVFRKGILKIDNKGDLTVLNNNYTLMDVNSFFQITNNEMILKLDYNLMERKVRPNPCSAALQFFGEKVLLASTSIREFIVSHSMLK